MDADEVRARIAHIRALLLSMAITREKAKEMAAPILEEINGRGLAIAKRHGKRYRQITFAGIMR